MSEIILHGELITPMGVMEALDIVEEELGTDLRQYLESYLMEDGVPESWTESDLLADQKEHFLAVLDSIDVKAATLEQQLSENRISRKKILEEIEAIRTIIEREEKHGKESI